MDVIGHDHEEPDPSMKSRMPAGNVIPGHRGKPMASSILQCSTSGTPSGYRCRPVQAPQAGSELAYCSVDLRSTTAVGDRRYRRERGHRKQSEAKGLARPDAVQDGFTELIGIGHLQNPSVADREQPLPAPARPLFT